MYGEPCARRQAEVLDASLHKAGELPQRLARAVEVTLDHVNDIYRVDVGVHQTGQHQQDTRIDTLRMLADIRMHATRVADVYVLPLSERQRLGQLRVGCGVDPGMRQHNVSR